ncbi:MAG: hypothetical protein ACJA0U_002236 [Salibacteraceae bacterium]|jgi:hypothetical protein
MYGPITDTTVTLYPDSGELVTYVDSLSSLDSNFQSPQGVIQSHVLEISIRKFSGNKSCTTRFDTGHRKKPAASIARECAEKVFHFPQ